MTFCVAESRVRVRVKSCDVSIFNYSRSQRPFEPITEHYNCIKASDAPFVVKCQSFTSKSLLYEAPHRENPINSSERCKLLFRVQSAVKQGTVN